MSVTPRFSLARRRICAGVAPIIENILAAFDAAHNAHGITGGLIAGIQRQFDEGDALAMIAALKPWRDRILGVGLGGPEIGHPPSKFRRAFAAARSDYGWGTVAHAGEEGGADYVRDALDTLKVDRIDHGVRCDDDPNLVSRLAEEHTPLTVCPCSNIALRLFSRRSRTIFASCTRDEDLWQMARNSFTSAYMSEELRSRYLSELDSYRPKPGIRR
jgi:adenosine deaminase